MHTGDNNNDFIVDAIEDCIGEATDKHPLGVSMNRRIPGGIRNNIVKCGFNGCQKLIAQPSTLALIPEKCFLDVRSSRGTKQDRHHRAWLRIR